MAQISPPVFLYGFVALIFGPPFLYFAWRTGQRWKRGEDLITGRLFAVSVAYSMIFGLRGISTGQWILTAFAFLLLIGSSWMWLVERNDSRA